MNTICKETKVEQLAEDYIGTMKNHCTLVEDLDVDIEEYLENQKITPHLCCSILDEYCNSDKSEIVNAEIDKIAICTPNSNDLWEYFKRKPNTDDYVILAYDPDSRDDVFLQHIILSRHKPIVYEIMKLVFVNKNVKVVPSLNLEEYGEVCGPFVFHKDSKMKEMFTNCHEYLRLCREYLDLLANEGEF